MHPVTVVRDDADGLIVWLAVNTPTLETLRADGREKRAEKSTQFTAPRMQVRSRWNGSHNLRIAPCGKRWSVWCFFDGGSGEFEGWYVNIEEPHRREPNATITRDQILDLLVSPDRSHVRKDEDEMEQAIPQQRLTPVEADDIRSVAKEVEAIIDAWGSPFCDGWERFKPDLSWPMPGPATDRLASGSRTPASAIASTRPRPSCAAAVRSFRPTAGARSAGHPQLQVETTTRHLGRQRAAVDGGLRLQG